MRLLQKGRLFQFRDLPCRIPGSTALNGAPRFGLKHRGRERPTVQRRREKAGDDLAERIMKRIKSSLKRLMEHGPELPTDVISPSSPDDGLHGGDEETALFAFLIPPCHCFGRPQARFLEDSWYGYSSCFFDSRVMPAHSTWPTSHFSPLCSLPSFTCVFKLTFPLRLLSRVTRSWG